VALPPISSEARSPATTIQAPPEENAPGKLVALNTDDDDGDGFSDLGQEQVVGEDDLVEVVTQTIGFDNWSEGTLKVTYDSNIKLYYSSDKQSVIPNNFHLSPGVTYYVEGVSAGTAFVTWTYDLFGKTFTDKVALTVLSVDIDVDSNNDGQITESEDAGETQNPGKILLLNDDVGHVMEAYDLSPVVIGQVGGTSQPPAGSTLTIDYNDDNIQLYASSNATNPIDSGDEVFPGTTIYAGGLHAGTSLITLTLAIGAVEVTDTVRISVARVDLDADSNNSGEITDADDPIEEQLPGQLIQLNDDDDDNNDVADLSDAEEVAGEDDLVELKARDQGFEVPFVTSVIVTYDDSIVKLYHGSNRGAPIASGTHMSPGSPVYAEGVGIGDTLVTWTYTVAGKSRADKVRLTVFQVDIDTDSNNDGTIDPDNDLATGTDDPIEIQDPGRILFVNTDDDNNNDVEDKNEPGSVAGENDLVPLVTREVVFPQGASGGTFTVQYTDSIVKLYLGSDRSDFIVSGAQLAPDTTLYAEGLQAGSTFVTWTYTVGNLSFSDQVKLTVYNRSLDLDIDSDNNDGFDLPENSNWEESLEVNPYGLGKLVMQNYGDVDPGEAGTQFTPVVLNLPPNLDPNSQNVKVRIDYDPLGLAGYIDVWNIDMPPGGMPLRVDVLDGGHRFTPEGQYSLNEIGYNPATGQVIIYVSAWAENSSTKTLAGVEANGKPDERIKATLVTKNENDWFDVASDEAKYIVAQPDSFFYHLDGRQEVRNELASRGVYSFADMPNFSLKELSPQELLERGVPQDIVLLLGNGSGIPGFGATLYQDFITGEDQYVLAFAGTDDLQDWIDNVWQGLGIGSNQYNAAMRIAFQLVNNSPGIPTGHLIATGHSLGGGLASAAAVAGSIPADTFNAAGLHPNTLNDMLARQRAIIMLPPLLTPITWITIYSVSRKITRQ
jgi:hypothetical protein